MNLRGFHHVKSLPDSRTPTAALRSAIDNLIEGEKTLKFDDRPNILVPTFVRESITEELYSMAYSKVKNHPSPKFELDGNDESYLAPELLIKDPYAD